MKQESLRQFIEKKNIYAKWGEYALEALPYLLDCALNKKNDNLFGIRRKAI